MSHFLKHQTAMALSIRLVESLGSVLANQSEQKECFGLFYEIIMESIKQYDEKSARERNRLGHPSQN